MEKDLLNAHIVEKLVKICMKWTCIKQLTLELDLKNAQLEEKHCKVWCHLDMQSQRDGSDSNLILPDLT